MLQRKSKCDTNLSIFIKGYLRKVENALIILNGNKNKSWKSLIENDSESGNLYPIIEKKYAVDFRKEVNKEIKVFMVENYPSLKESL